MFEKEFKQQDRVCHFSLSIVSDCRKAFSTKKRSVMKWSARWGTRTLRKNRPQMLRKA